MSQSFFLEEVTKILPKWDIEIIPHDYIEFPEKYTGIDIKIIAKHKEYSKIIIEKSVKTIKGWKDVYGNVKMESPRHLTGVYHLILSVVNNARDESEQYFVLHSELCSHFAQIFNKRKSEEIENKWTAKYKPEI